MRLTATTAALLTTSTLLWAGNAVVGRAVVGLVSPITLNFIRWCLAFCILLPLAPWVLRRGSGLWPMWRRYALLGLLGVGSYNALQYLALRTSTPVNVTLVASTMPLWMLALGRLFFGMRVTRMQMAGVALSMAGVLVVLARGRWQQLAQLQLVPGDLYMLLATLCWAWYSWLLPARAGEPTRLRADWAALLLGQVASAWAGRACSRAPNGPRAMRSSTHPGRSPRPCSSWRWAPPCWPIAAGAWGWSARGRLSPGFSPTSRQSLPPSCRRCFWARRPSCTTAWRLR